MSRVYLGRDLGWGPADAPAPPAPPAALNAKDRDGRPLDAADAWAHNFAADVLQSIADSDPDEDTIGAQEALEGTPYEHMYCLDGSEIVQAVYVALSNAFYDGFIRLGSGDAREGA